MLLLTLLSLACAPDDGPPPQAPPPPALALHIDPTVVGAPATLRVQGAPPGATVAIVASTTGFGSSCPAALGGACVDLLPQYQVITTLTAGADGAGSLTFTPGAALSGRTYAVQAAVAGPAVLLSRATTVWFAPVGTDVAPDADLDQDGLTRAEGDCHDGSASTFPGAPEVLGDRRDLDCDGLDGTDVDRDGFAPASLGGDDCDDHDPQVHVGAPELCDGSDDDCDGDVDEGMDGDGNGFADCREIAVIATTSFLSNASGYTCEGETAVDRELEVLAGYLSAVGLHPVRIDESPNHPITAEQLAPYGAVIVHNGGWQHNLMQTSTVEALLALPDTPMMWMGDDAAFLAHSVAAPSGHPELLDVLHVGAFSSNGLANQEIVVTDALHPVMSGPAGAVGGFTYAGDLDITTTSGTGEVVLMTSATTNTPIVWAADDGRRVAVMLPNVYAWPFCPASTPDGLLELETLVQNMALWLVE